MAEQKPSPRNTRHQTPSAAARDRLAAFHVMAKPTGAACNLRCDYCFFLGKSALYPGSHFRMSEEVHEAYIRQLFEGHHVPQVTVAWQGGEPSLMGLEFFERSVELQKRYAKPGTRIENTFQTNGILINDAWCRFFHDHRFLVGLSMDGPRECHDTYRKDKGGGGTFDQVMKAARLLQEHHVEFNILCAVNSMNAEHPLEVYRFFRDELGAAYVQFIPIVERDKGGGVTDRSVRPGQWGGFLCRIFDEWVARDVGKMFVLNFDGALAGWLGKAGTVCIFGATCGLGAALEHNGDLYACDHFVDSDHYLGNIMQTPLAEIMGSAQQRKFGNDKRDSLTPACLSCEFVFVCNGECPKNRFSSTRAGEPGQNYLCEGYKLFFRHADHSMRIMAALLRQGRCAGEIMKLTAMRENGNRGVKLGRNEPCFCGSGVKFKKCHGA